MILRKIEYLSGNYDVKIECEDAWIGFYIKVFDTSFVHWMISNTWQSQLFIKMINLIN